MFWIFASFPFDFVVTLRVVELNFRSGTMARTARLDLRASTNGTALDDPDVR